MWRARQRPADRSQRDDVSVASAWRPWHNHDVPEAELYDPIKRFLEAQGYLVKGEISPCDVVAVRNDEPPVIVELKEQFNLALILQAVDRLTVSDGVYVAFRVGDRHSAAWRSRRRQALALFRRLGLGLLTVSSRGRVEAVLDPAPYRPRVNVKRCARLLKEFSERVGDPEAGGSASRQRLTAYRQDALRCARALSSEQTLKVALVRQRTGVERAGPILRDNHYGWFERVTPGHYALSPKGRHDLDHWSQSFDPGVRHGVRHRV